MPTADMKPGDLSSLLPGVLGYLQRQNRNTLYYTRPDIWAEDFLGVKLTEKQIEMSMSVVNNHDTAVKAGHGVGKLINVQELLSTPDGWVRAGDVQVGQKLFDESGAVTTITAKTPVWDDAGYRITFDDHTTIEAGANHEWGVLDLTKRSRAAGTKSGVIHWGDHWDTAVMKTTQELHEEGLKTASNQNRWRIAVTKPLQLPVANLPIDPYLLGFWLGDGTSSNGDITIGQTKTGLLDWLAENGWDYSVKWDRETRALVRVPALGKLLKNLGVKNNKHIPMVYLRSCIEQRRELLAGLMDSDGFQLNQNSSVGIDLTHKRLSSDVYDLLMTLGQKVYASEGVAAYTLDGKRHATGIRYRLNWTPKTNPFKIRNGDWKRSKHQVSVQTQRTIVSIESIGRVQNFCIEVDSPRHLYLAGRSLIPTHNSMWAGVIICWWIDTRVPTEGLTMVVSTAPDFSRVNAIVWKEVRRYKAQAEKRFKEYQRRTRTGEELGEYTWADHALPGYVTADAHWRLEGGMEVGYGRKPPDSKEDGLAGVHGKVLAIGDEACHDDETEVLTRDGWKLFSDCTMDDEFITMDMKTEKSEYQKPSRLVRYKYEGDLYYYGGQKGMNLAVTPNHDILYRSTSKNSDRPLRKSRADDMTFSNKSVPRVINWDGLDDAYINIPEFIGKRKYFPELRVKSEYFSRFAGWFYSEGSINKSLNTVSIWQSMINSDNRSEIRETLDNLGFKYVEDERSFRIHNTQLARYLAESGRTCDVKRLTMEIKGWSPRLLDVFLDAYVKGDGYRRGGQDVIYTSCREMADDLQEVILKTGKPSVVSERELGSARPLKTGRIITSSRNGFVVTRPLQRSEGKLFKSNLTIRKYNGEVFCATVPNGTLLTRRRGRTAWSGNCGLPAGLITDLGNITSTDACRVVLIGNPINPLSAFGKIFREPDGNWSLLTITVFDSPNFHGGGRCWEGCNRKAEHDLQPYGLGFSTDALRDLVDQGYVDRKLAEYKSVTSPGYLVRVMGEFAWDVGPTLISMEDMAVGIDVKLEPSSETLGVLGVDVARFGEDKSVAYHYHDGVLRLADSWEKKSGTETARIIHDLALGLSVSEVRIDGSGLGGPIADLVYELAEDKYLVIEMIGGARSPDRNRWYNARAFWYDNFADRLRHGLIDIDPADDDLEQELLGIEYKFPRSGIQSLLIESKDDMRKRGVGSPDFADAAIYATADVSGLVDSPYRSLDKGDVVLLNPWDSLNMRRDAPGNPL